MFVNFSDTVMIILSLRFIFTYQREQLMSNAKKRQLLYNSQQFVKSNFPFV